MELNKEQQRAVENFTTDLLVMAGAGTGKTRVLTQKYLYLLQTRKFEVPQIVAVTFTHKAADEMRSRIRQEMKTAYQESCGSEREYWARQLALLEVAAKITTIHGLCFAILTQHPVEAGIDPQVNILDEGEEALFKTKAARKALHNLLSEDREGQNLPVVLALGANFFLEHLPALYTSLKETGAELDNLPPAMPAGPVLGALTDLSTKLNNVLFDLRQQAAEVKLTPRAQDLLSALFARWPDYRSEIAACEGLSEDGLRVLNDLLALLPKNLNQKLRPQIDTVHEVVAAIKNKLLTREAAAQQPVLIAFLRQFDREYNQLKRLSGKLDFTDQQFLVRQLLRAYPEITAEYQQRFAYIMVDEFQDTNSLQWEIIQLLCGNGYRGGRLFLVGDLKQSIYRFRGAEVEIMTSLADSKLGQRGEVQVLTKNYRTKPAVAEVINSFCRAIFATEAFPYHPLVPVGIDASCSGPAVEFLIVQEEEPVMLAARVRQLVESGKVLVGVGESKRPLRYGDLALLFRVRTHIKSYEDAFRVQGIPYQVTAGVGFYARQEIQDQLNLLRSVEQPADSLALAGVLRSPFCQISDAALFWLASPNGLLEGFYQADKATDYPAKISDSERKRLIRLRHLLTAMAQNAHLLSIPALLRSAWTETGYIETVAAFPDGERCLANLEKLILRAEEFAAKGYSGVSDFVAFLRHLSTLEVREGEAAFSQAEGDFVQMMTIHAAKGLEFPVVILPELDGEFNLSSRSPVVYNKDFGIVHKLKDPDGNWLDTELTTKIKEQEKRAELSELKRLFYVGITRARDYLLCSATAKECKAKNIDEGRSWLDWLVQVLPDIGNAEEGEVTLDGYPIKITRTIPLTAGEGGPAVREEEAVKAVPTAEIASTLELPLHTGKMTTRRLSLTPLLTFQECPRRFYWQHRLGSDPASVPAEHRTTEERVSSNFSLLLGEVFHRLISGPSLGKAEASTTWSGWFQGLAPEEKQEAMRQLEIMRQNYLASPFCPEANVRVENELPFVLSLKGVIIKGIIDRILFYPDGRLVVVDFKTNRRLPPPGKIRDRYYFQVYLYTLALREIYRRLPTEAWIYFVRPNIQLPCALNEKNLAATEEQILKTVEYITTHDLPEDYPPGEDCEFCPFAEWCAEAVASSQ